MLYPECHWTLEEDNLGKKIVRKKWGLFLGKKYNFLSFPHCVFIGQVFDPLLAVINEDKSTSVRIII